MTFNFDKITDRRGTNSLKWDVGENELPLWVADMDFPTAPAILKALEKRVAHGIFGYSVVPEEWAKSYIFWWKTRHNFEIKPDWLIFTTGVVPAISTCVRKLTTPAEKVLIPTPCYNIFFNSIVNNGRFPVESPLAFDEKTGRYSIDFVRLEKDLSDPQVSLMILCNPQNPTGNIWSKDDLAKVGELCKKHGVTVFSDEIHCDIAEPGKGYVPFASASKTCAEISVTGIAPTKCFNIAGINSAAVVVPNPILRHKVWRALNTDEVAEPNAFAVDATIAAFTKGGEWLDSLNKYLTENRKFAADFIEKLNKDCRVRPDNDRQGKFDNGDAHFTVVSGEATYLLWVKVPEKFGSGDEFASELRKKTGLYIAGGSEYGKAGESFVRINLACPRSVLEDAMKRFEKFVKN